MPVNWERIQGLQGEIVETADRRKRLRVASVSDSEVWLEEERNGEWQRQQTPVPRDEVDRLWDDLWETGHLCKRYFDDQRHMSFERGGAGHLGRGRAIFALLSSAYPQQVQAYPRDSGLDPCNERFSGIRIVST